MKQRISTHLKSSVYLEVPPQGELVAHPPTPIRQQCSVLDEPKDNALCNLASSLGCCCRNVPRRETVGATFRRKDYMGHVSEIEFNSPTRPTRIKRQRPRNSRQNWKTSSKASPFTILKQKFEHGGCARAGTTPPLYNGYTHTHGGPSEADARGGHPRGG